MNTTAARAFGRHRVARAVGAQLITSAQIENGTIQAVDLSPAVTNKLNEAGRTGRVPEHGPGTGLRHTTQAQPIDFWPSMVSRMMSA
ncbi:hypothetical protein GCM10023349_42860 [Nocardioides conyzicola]|uniref:Uncharacterized protein n=1 Tax=Nocardioides conyzicola TaxID=1651781 RepID=A0ABP8Y075_9ACTN